ncbi:DUF1423 domain-containing protein, partial [Cephalotus follicularis]
MGMSSGSNINHQSASKMLPPRQQPRPGGLQTSLSLVSLDPRLSPDGTKPRSNSDNISESPTESASSSETWPTADAALAKKMENGKAENECPELSVIRCVSSADKISLRDIARDRVDVISEKMYRLPDEFQEELMSGLRVILEGNGGSQQREEFLILQKLVQSRTDLTAKTLIRAHRVQLEILVAINSGIQEFLHPNISLSQTSLIEVFVYKRCRNITCQNQLPADYCTCEICTNRNGFCNICMCVICNKFDFAVNTCRWMGCDMCSHWTHTDCAIRDGQICMGPSVNSGAGPTEMLFRCRACNWTSELLGWVKDVFQHCAAWDRDSLMKELDLVSRIFRGSEDSRGRKLFWKCEELLGKMKGGLAESMAGKAILMYFQGPPGAPSSLYCATVAHVTATPVSFSCATPFPDSAVGSDTKFRWYSSLTTGRSNTARSSTEINLKPALILGSRYESTAAASEASAPPVQKYEYQAEVSRLMDLI